METPLLINREEYSDSGGCHLGENNDLWGLSQVFNIVVRPTAVMDLRSYLW